MRIIQDKIFVVQVSKLQVNYIKENKNKQEIITKKAFYKRKKKYINIKENEFRSTNPCPPIQKKNYINSIKYTSLPKYFLFYQNIMFNY
jgi:hypothetical protein